MQMQEQLACQIGCVSKFAFNRFSTSADSAQGMLPIGCATYLGLHGIEQDSWGGASSSAQLQLGREQGARQVFEEFTRGVKINPSVFIGPYAAVAIPARLALEQGNGHSKIRNSPSAGRSRRFRVRSVRRA